MKLKKSPDGFKILIIEAARKLQNYDFEESYRLIVNALSDNPHAPEPHNLLGIWFELKQDNDSALKHYRAAYALDPSYKPACKNIERICTNPPFWDLSYDYGVET